MPTHTKRDRDRWGREWKSLRLYWCLARQKHWLHTTESELKSSPHTLEQCLTRLYLAVTSPGRCGQKQVEEIYLHTRRKINNNRQWLDWPMFNQVHRTECRRIDEPRCDLEHSINPQCPSFFSEISGVFVHCSVSCLCDIFHNDILIPVLVSHFLQKIKFEFVKQMKNIRRKKYAFMSLAFCLFYFIFVTLDWWRICPPMTRYSNNCSLYKRDNKDGRYSLIKDSY